MSANGNEEAGNLTARQIHSNVHRRKISQAVFLARSNTTLGENVKNITELGCWLDTLGVGKLAQLADIDDGL